ncbi:hypothetical protein C0J52_23911 [Blattella germanica]|uniref:Chemosensory protein n=1 Tax=Blattella germanica TaxID=6973 RepID=A0A0X8DBH0_BLAGE|nr:chemosensory protein [Blattella germanica]PSN34982.1 hypothetical protein C0J52_23911 [Blattella germanica]
MHPTMLPVVTGSVVICAILFSHLVVCEVTEDEIEKNCEEKFGVDESIFVDIDGDGNEDAIDEFDITLKDEENEDHRCFIECLMEGYGYIKNGRLDVDFLVEEVLIELEEEGIEIDVDELRGDIAFCADQHAEGKCSTSYTIAKCLFNLQKKRRR